MVWVVLPGQLLGAVSTLIVVPLPSGRETQQTLWVRCRKVVSMPQLGLAEQNPVA